MASPIDGGTVLVTGASSGIGQSIAEQIAHRAKSLLLVARRKDRLDALAERLRSKHPALEVRTYACDVADRAGLDRFIEEVRTDGCVVDVLINNAGLGDMGVFHTSKLEKQLFMVDVNIAALVRLTHAFLPGMVERGRGGVLMVSSGFGLAYLPGFSTYVGTKHFVTGFTESLHTELAGTGVVVSQVCPGPVATEFEQNVGNFTGMRVPSFVELSADACAAAAISGIDRHRALVVPHFLIRFVIWVTLRTPRFLTRFVLRIVGKRLRTEQEKRAIAAT